MTTLFSTLTILRSRTVWFAILLAVLSVVQGYLGIFKLDPQTEMIAGCVIAACITVLRIITTQPLGAK
jgi:quinol-cytochrome oxidoreductase complex cytochrome b subunit